MSTDKQQPPNRQQLQSYQPASATNTNTVLGLHGALRYPFAPMNLGWLHEYVSSLGSPERYIAMCRILECLMAIAVSSTYDPFLEHAVVNFYTKFSAESWNKVQSHQAQSGGHLALDGMTFELSRQVFEVIGLIRRFPGSAMKSRKMLLTIVERMLDEAVKVTATSPSLTTNRSIPEIVSSVKGCVGTLKKLHSGGAFSMNSAAAEGNGCDVATANEETAATTTTALTTTTQTTPPTPEEEAATNTQIEESLQHLSSWLKYLFFALSSTRPVLVPACPPPPPGVNLVTNCSESCACFSAFKNKFPIYLSDVEKVKVIDSLLVCGHGATAEEEMFAFAQELLLRYTIDFCSRAVSHVQNGQFTLCRFYIFDALRVARRSQSGMPSGGGVCEDAHALDLIEIALLRTQATCKSVAALSTVSSSLVPKALTSLSRVRNTRNQQLSAEIEANVAGGVNDQPQKRPHAPTSPSTVELYALQKHLTSIFQALCNQQFLLCVHYHPHQQYPQQQQLGIENNERLNAIAITSESKEIEGNTKGIMIAVGAVQKVEPVPESGTSAPPPPSASSQTPPPKPVVSGPPKCANPSCATTNGDLLKCSACKITWYCSRNCQQADWKSHKPFCKKASEERLQLQQQQQQQSGNSANGNNTVSNNSYFSFKFSSANSSNGPTAAAAHWLAEKCEKPIQAREIIEVKPIGF